MTTIINHRQGTEDYRVSNTRTEYDGMETTAKRWAGTVRFHFIKLPVLGSHRWVYGAV